MSQNSPRENEPEPRDSRSGDLSEPTGRRRHRASKSRLKVSPLAAADRVFLIAAGLAALWMAWFLLTRALAYGVWSILLLIPLWGAISYLTLPRMNKILADIYVPHYFIGRARTSDGLLGDPINLALNGSTAQLHTAMTAAGWRLADPVTASSSGKIIASTLTRKSYPTAPVSPLMLFDRIQDLAYEKESEENPSERHHVRFWRCEEDWRLPGGRDVDWVAASTYDKSVGVSLFTLQVTHHIASDTDRERDFLVSSVTEADRGIGVDVIEHFSSGYHSRNGGGDQIQTDGSLPILQLGDVSTTAEARKAAEETDRQYKAHQTAANAESLSLSDLREASPLNRSARGEAKQTSLVQRPFSIFLGTLLIVGSGLLGLVKIGIDVWHWDDFWSDLSVGGLVSGLSGADQASARSGISVAVLAVIGGLFLLQLLFLWMMFHGSQAARMLLMALTILSVAASAFEYYASGGSSFVLTAVHVIALTGALLEFSGQETSHYVSVRQLQRSGEQG